MDMVVLATAGRCGQLSRIIHRKVAGAGEIVAPTRVLNDKEPVARQRHVRIDAGRVHITIGKVGVGGGDRNTGTGLQGVAAAIRHPGLREDVAKRDVLVFVAIGIQIGKVVGDGLELALRSGEATQRR
jgi:hypothetical protein